MLFFGELARTAEQVWRARQASVAVSTDQPRRPSLPGRPGRPSRLGRHHIPRSRVLVGTNGNMKFCIFTLHCELDMS